MLIDQKTLQHTFNQKEINMRQQKYDEFLNDYECKIHYYLGKENVVADALSRKEQTKPLSIKAPTLTIHSNLTI